MNTSIEDAPPEARAVAYVPTGPIKKTGRRFHWGKILAGAAIITVIGIGIGGIVYHAAGFETTDDAFLEANVHPVSPRINGTVSRVLVDDNAHVQAGQPLVEIDPADLNLAVRGAEADLAQARANADHMSAQAARARAEVAAATARIAQNAAQLTRAQLDFHRTEMLAGDNARAISTQERDAARAGFDVAQAAKESLVAEQASAEAAFAAAQAQRSVALAQIQKAETALATANLQADYTVIRAPISGRIAKKSVEVGQRLQPGQPVLAVVDDQVWVVANFKEGQLTHLRVGQNVTMTVDAVDGRVFHGVVDSFSPGTGAKFSLLPPDNATGNFTKVVQRVSVKILFSPDSLGADADHLVPGLSAIVKIGIRH